MLEDYRLEYKSVPCVSKLIKLEIGDSIVFRQDLLHQGMVYDEENLRIFYDLKLSDERLDNDEDAIQVFDIDKSQLLTIKKFENAKVYIPNNKKFIQ